MADTLVEETPAQRSRVRQASKWIAVTLAGIVGAIVLALVVLNSPIGQRWIADEIAKVAPASGLRIEIGRIEGNIYGRARLHDVVLLDPKGPFLTIPEAELDWRPLSWLTSGLDVRELTARRGTLLRLPELLPGDPDAPILPDFDIRIDEFRIDNLTVAPGVAGQQAQRIDLTARADIRAGRVLLDADGRLGRRDRIALLLDAEPDGNRFDLELDVRAPRGGVIAGIVGTDSAYDARIVGDGTWNAWRGAFVARRDGEVFSAFQISNRAGRYGIVGQAYPGDTIEGLAGRALGETVSLAAFGTLQDSVLDGEFALRGGGLDGSGSGTVDLAGNAFEDFEVMARLKDPALFSPDFRFEGATLAATLDGAFRDLTIEHRLGIERLVSGETSVSGIEQAGEATYDGTRWVLPVDARVARVATGNALLDPRLVSGTANATVTWTGTRLESNDLAIAFPGATARLVLRGETARGAYALAGPVTLNGLPLENVGTVNAGANIRFRVGSGVPWSLDADVNGRIPRVTNATLANLAGPAIAFRGGVGMGGARPLSFRNLTVDAAKLDLFLDGSVAQGRTSLAGRGRHVDYGPFTVSATLADAGPSAVLVFADPYPAAGLKDVRVAIAPTRDGFSIETEGQSLLGPFDGTLGLFAPTGGPTRIAVQRLDIWKTTVTGDIVLGAAGPSGTLALAGGGLDGTIALSQRSGGQAFDVNLTANNARFGGETPIALNRATITGSGLLVEGRSTIEGSVFAQGVSYGNLFLGRVAAQAELVNGSGQVTASLAGRRGGQFTMQLNAQVAPSRVAVAARGEFAGRRITMPRRAVLLRQADGGWVLQRSQLNYGRGVTLVEGRFGGGETALDLQLARMPLSLLDLAVADLGVGGSISGMIEYGSSGRGVPTGSARVEIANLRRSGLVLSSSPIDVALVARLSADRLEARAAIDEGGNRRGRLQGRITGMPESGELFERLQRGNLFAQLRYGGPAEALWRLAAIEAFDLTGPVSIAANVTGTLADPQVRGSVASNTIRLQSALSGTDVREASVRGTFAGSRLRLTRFAGSAGEGRVSGSGSVDLSNLGERGPGLDIRVAASNARLLNARGLSATVTGPLRIVSNGVGGTIAGRVLVNRASWRLGSAASAEQLPRIATREINLPADVAPRAAPSQPWRYLIDARAPSRVDVDGLGLESEWGANIRVRGTTDDPRIGGEATMIRGDYTFAGTTFELTRGRIAFDQTGPIDPRLDIVAESERDGLQVFVEVRGSALQPEVTFRSVPALPEEEVLAQLLFGGSITELSATDALQLGAAVASLRGGSGMDPINRLRSAIGLDRLRIVSADPALGRGTGIALGKNIGRRIYVEIVTDGRGYSATEVEYRVTSWLALLGSISTIGRESVKAEISRDY
jgi:translocation and assembly module TamB